VAWNHAWHSGREFAFDYMKIGPANAACQHFQQNVAGFGFRRRHVLKLERRLRNWSRSGKDCGLHE
jgi:hypothetical protein